MRSQQCTVASTPCQLSKNATPQTIICNGAWTSEWVADLEALLKRSEEAELELSYSSPCRSEKARKQAGAYYTPRDAAHFFWNEFVSLNGISSATEAREFWTNHHFIEPACGAGALVYALLKKFVELGLPIDAVASVEMTLIDINKDALDFIRCELETLGSKWGISFPRIKFIRADFLSCTLPVSPRKPLVFGNPPFVSNPRGNRWKNTFADFVERSLKLSGDLGQIHFILPLSLAFSRDYSALRNMMRCSGKTVALSNFDNIPDTLFPSGKPENTNTNKANSQRCSIVTVLPSVKPQILVTRMHRWRKKDRERLLTSHPYYHDVTDYSFDGQFPRPENQTIMRLLGDSEAHPLLKSLLVKDSKNTLFVSAVALNFIGLRDESSSGVNRLCFRTKTDLHKAEERLKVLERARRKRDSTSAPAKQSAGNELLRPVQERGCGARFLRVCSLLTPLQWTSLLCASAMQH